MGINECPNCTEISEFKAILVIRINDATFHF